MYLSRLSLRANANSHQLALQLCRQDSYIDHQQLWRLFGDDPDAQRDFLFRRDDQQSWPHYYLLSSRKPRDDNQQWILESRAFHPQFKVGDRLSFSLRANPVISRKSEGGGRSKRHDLVMDMKQQMGWKDMPPSKRPPAAAIWQKAGEQWLGSRLLKNGAELNSSIAERYTQHRDRKRKTGQTLKYSSLDLMGTLTITEPEVFLNLLLNGIGPAKSLGCGLLLVRRL